MCGIAGIIDLNEPNLAERAVLMSNCLRHRGPDDSGVWADQQVGVTLAHRRLSILDLSPEGRQPMFSPCGRYVITYNGEIYNWPEIRLQLEKSSVRIDWRGHSDTEVLLAAISCWGLETTLQRLVGMFAFALWDRKNQTLNLVRDRLGEKPLYYGCLGDAFLFGSELKALAAHPKWRGELDLEALTAFFRYGYIPNPLSIFKNVFKLPPGCLLAIYPKKRIDVAELKPACYWSNEKASKLGAMNPFQGSDREAVDVLDHLLSSTIKQQMVADVPLGAFLSGGIDSSTVVALMQEQSSRAVRTFTIGFSSPDYDESNHARKVARHLGTDHTELIATHEDALEIIPKIPTLFDEPFADASQIPTFLVSRLTRQHVSVSLSGDGGDELFGGYNRYRLAGILKRRLFWLPHFYRQILSRGLKLCPTILPDRVENWLGPTFERFGRRGPLADKMTKFADLISEKDGTDLYRGLLSVWREPSSLVLGAMCDGSYTANMKGQAFLSFEEQMMLLDISRYLPDDILTKVDRAAMAVSLETRIPLLDHRIVEFSLRLPMHLKIRGGIGKWILKEVLYRRLPRDFFARPKRGFAVPLDGWLRGPLREWADDLLAEGRLRREGILDPRPIQDRWRRHLAGEGQHQTALWSALMFQAWHADWQNKTTNISGSCSENSNIVSTPAGGASYGY